ncbi:MAG TPA: hypothetical protein VF412_03035 [Bdellovibrio sp.]|uniref:hypothetical protein n=1 Tax=Bdellovibrio sp. TaxID=28201 RepID=UPI002EDE9209
MKHQTILAIILVFFSVNVFADSSLPEKEVQIGLSGAYVPGGFDSASDVYVIVNGIFQNGCYKWKRADVENKDAFNHSIKSIASVSQGMCIMVLMPFQKEVHLGKLASGKHTLRFENGDGTYFEKSMTIE